MTSGLWQVAQKGGIFLPQIGWYLDSQFPKARSFVSHAHFDHLARHRVTLCSERTSRLVAKNDNGSLLYTGDFKLRPGLSAELCATPLADTLVMETTYGLPRYRFPPTEEVMADMTAFRHRVLNDKITPIPFGYSLGKSQKILSALKTADVPIMLHPQVEKMTRVYEQCGLEFPLYSRFNESYLPGHVVICPPQSGQKHLVPDPHQPAHRHHHRLGLGFSDSVSKRM
jgi:hypothetical protein